MISNKQVWVGVVSKGSDGTALNSSYANRLYNCYFRVRSCGSHVMVMTCDA